MSLHIGDDFDVEIASQAERARLLHEILDSSPVDAAQPRGIDLAAMETDAAPSSTGAPSTTGEAAAGADEAVDQRGNDPFSVLVHRAGDASSAARIELENKHVPWDVFIPRVCAALGIDGVDVVRDVSGAQVTSVEYLNEADELAATPLAVGGGAEGSASASEGAEAEMSEMIAHIVRGGALEMPPFSDRARYIPIRLTLQERKALRLLKSALAVSEYTGTVDSDAFRTKARRTHAMLHEICAMVSAVVVAWDYGVGAEQLRERDFKKNAVFIRKIFEIGRRHKIMNPEKLRSDYGKLIYMLQDSCGKKCSKLLDLPLIAPVRTAYDLLSEGGAAKMLDDPLMDTATRQLADDKSKSRGELQEQLRAKDRAIKTLARKYATAHERAASGRGLSSTKIKSVLYSIGDNSSYLGDHALPVERMIRECSFIYRYILRESCSQFDSLPLTSLTISQAS